MRLSAEALSSNHIAKRNLGYRQNDKILKRYFHNVNQYNTYEINLNYFPILQLYFLPFWKPEKAIAVWFREDENLLAEISTHVKSIQNIFNTNNMFLP